MAKDPFRSRRENLHHWNENWNRMSSRHRNPPFSPAVFQFLARFGGRIPYRQQLGSVTYKFPILDQHSIRVRFRFSCSRSPYLHHFIGYLHYGVRHLPEELALGFRPFGHSVDWVSRGLFWTFSVIGSLNANIRVIYWRIGRLCCEWKVRLCGVVIGSSLYCQWGLMTRQAMGLFDGLCVHW